ncbi:transketolase family protein [Candidatus Epulonipiscium viviparus]|uniref:transketolase family protein n=1 Tax=Candidatus Epulonipiscium viviparus TaxID=420336 RepID=UPI0027380774|nr:transketolase C-terminal domain-containing protein [Candidatus Epulopiscium viviparus]
MTDKEFKKTARTLSLLGQRGALGVAIDMLGKSNDKICALTGDLKSSCRLERFASAHPDRFFNVGIAEQNMVGIAAGLASEGFIPFAASFANFNVMRANEFVKNFMGYMKENIKLVSINCGFSSGMLGNSHYALEDVAALSAIPNITILSPADSVEAQKAVIAAAEYDGPVYIRLTGDASNPIVYKQDYDFVIGKPICLKEDGNIALLAAGTSVYHCLVAASALAAEGIHAAVWNVHTLSQIDDTSLDEICKSDMIITVEEHRKKGGLGSFISDQVILREKFPKLRRIGLDAKYDMAGTFDYCLEKNNLKGEPLVAEIKRLINS